MGEGLGAGGHSTRRYRFNAEASIRFLSPNLFSNLASPREAPAARTRPLRQVDRQFDVAAIRKLKISQTDTKTALPAAAALDHVARADRKPAGETVCKGTHEYPPESNATLGNFRHQCQNTATVPRQLGNRHRFLWIAVDKEPVSRTRAFRIGR